MYFLFLWRFDLSDLVNNIIMILKNATKERP